MRDIRMLMKGFLLLFITVTATVYAQTEKIALVIGNGDYQSLGRLSNPPNDATDIASALRSIGFDVELLIDAELQTMEEAVIRFGQKLSALKDAAGFFFFAGHGVQSDGENYLIPARASIGSESFLRTRTISAQIDVSRLSGAVRRSV